jgi:hypothetical protein
MITYVPASWSFMMLSVVDATAARSTLCHVMVFIDVSFTDKQVLALSCVPSSTLRASPLCLPRQLPPHHQLARIRTYTYTRRGHATLSPPTPTQHRPLYTHLYISRRHPHHLSARRCLHHLFCPTSPLLCSDFLASSIWPVMSGVSVGSKHVGA